MAGVVNPLLELLLRKFMGAVHGVHLKYVAMCAASAASARHLGTHEPSDPDSNYALAVWAATCVMWYSACVHFIISAGFISKSGMWILGKDPNTGQVPSWSYVLWAAFFIPTYLYTALHAGYADKKHGVPVASEVDDAFWIGGRYAAQLKKKWALTIDLTVEFDEGCMDTSDEYLLLRCWDGVPPKPHEIELAAVTAAQACRRGLVNVHCAHGRGRSTTVLAACLVRAGRASTWEEAFKLIHARRPVVKLNKKMRTALTEWQKKYGAAPWQDDMRT